jgi:hypothetical protein
MFGKSKRGQSGFLSFFSYDFRVVFSKKESGFILKIRVKYTCFSRERIFSDLYKKPNDMYN